MKYLGATSVRPPKVSLSLTQRKIMLCDIIDDESTYEFLSCVDKILEFDRKMNSQQPIEICINSGGGSVYHGFTIISKIEILKDMGYEVITTNIGMCFSMALFISLCGTKRKSYRFSRYMYHDISTVVYGKAQEIKEDLVECESLRKMGNDLIFKYSNIKEKDITNWIERKLDKYFSAEEALQLKICDIIE